MNTSRRKFLFGMGMAFASASIPCSAKSKHELDYYVGKMTLSLCKSFYPSLNADTVSILEKELHDIGDEICTDGLFDECNIKIDNWVSDGRTEILTYSMKSIKNGENYGKVVFSVKKAKNDMLEIHKKGHMKWAR